MKQEQILLFLRNQKWKKGSSERSCAFLPADLNEPRRRPALLLDLLNYSEVHVRFTIALLHPKIFADGLQQECDSINKMVPGANGWELPATMAPESPTLGISGGSALPYTPLETEAHRPLVQANHSLTGPLSGSSPPRFKLWVVFSFRVGLSGPLWPAPTLNAE